KKFSFPINDVILAKEFIAAIQNKYQLLPKTYILVNPTDKPELPQNADKVKLVNLTTPVTSPRVLVETAHLLKEHYFFKQIPAN
ncbi:2842_t:CDS:1, partial [Dentiscutata erythropus]